MSEDIQTLDRPLIGVRQYTVDDEGYLGSLTGRGSRWEPDKPQKAVCERYMEYQDDGTHSAPDRDCGCGYYAHYDFAAHEADLAAALGRWRSEYVPVRAVVSAWGDVDLHETGFRSEFMQVEAIIVDTLAHKPLSSWIDLIALAERYAVPLIDEADVDTFCRERGEVLDSRDLQAEHREAATKTAQESLSELHKSMRRMAESMLSSRNPLMTDAAWQAEVDRKRNQPAFWRNAAGGEIHNG